MCTMATAQSDDEVDRLVAELYSEQIPEDRLITVTRLWQVLRVDDAGEPNTAGGDSDRSRTAAAQRFVELKGPDAVHHRLHTMQKVRLGMGVSSRCEVVDGWAFSMRCVWVCTRFGRWRTPRMPVHFYKYMFVVVVCIHDWIER